VGREGSVFEMLVDDRDDLLIDKPTDGVADQKLLFREQVIDAVEIYSSKRHGTPNRRRYHSGVKPDSAIDIVQRLRQKGHEAYLVGGCVRDMVMNIEPADYDIATSAPPEEVMKIFPHTEPIGAQFGVVLVIQRGHPFEVATFRSDQAYVDGRRPTGVVFTDAQTDVLRRDFTINGLLYDPVEKRVIDYVSGQADIRDRIVRAIGDPQKRFEEDKLRLLRAVRFGARLGYTIESETWSAVCRMAPEIKRVSAERIREELARILTEGRASLGVRMLQEAGLLAAILPAVQWSDQLARSLELIPAKTPVDFAFAVLLQDVPVESVRRIAEELKLSGAETNHVFSLVRCRSRFARLPQLRVSELKRYLRSPRFEDHMELSRVISTAAGSSLEAYNYAVKMQRQWSAADIAPSPLLSGDDLIEFGFSPGPLFKEILTRVEDEQLEGRLQTKEQSLNFVKENYPR
jgi:tRNA nucleotidyltransferase/poly(A) polymerase